MNEISKRCEQAYKLGRAIGTIEILLQNLEHLPNKQYYVMRDMARARELLAELRDKPAPAPDPDASSRDPYSPFYDPE